MWQLRVTQGFPQDWPAGPRTPIHYYAYAIRAWTKGLPQLKELVHENVTPQPVFVYKVLGKLDPATCGAKRPASPKPQI